MKTTFIALRAVCVGVTLGLSTFCAQAVSLNEGDSLPLQGTSVALEPQLAGTVIVDENVPFSFGGITGHVQQRIVKSSKDGSLDFYWRVFNDATSTAAIGSFGLDGFDAAQYNVNSLLDNTGDGNPTYAFRGSLSEVLFLFTNGESILPGTSSRLFFIDTTATDYAKTALYNLTGTSSDNTSTSFTAYTPILKTVTPAPVVTPGNCPISAFSGEIFHIPFVSVPDAFGGVVYYKVDLKLSATSPSLAFQLTSAVQDPQVPSGCTVSTFNTDNTMFVPSVSVSDAFGGVVYYKVDMKLIAGSSPMRFNVTRAVQNPK